MHNPSDKQDTSANLSLEEETSLWLRASEGDEKAREELILAYRPLVFWMAKKFTVSNSIFPDLIQEGMIALIRAVDKFDPARKSRFTTYSFYRIKGQMVNFIQRKESRAPCPVDESLMDLRDPFSPDKIDDLISISQGLKVLPEREAEVISSMVIHGREAKEIAFNKGMDLSHVYRLKRKGIFRLRNWLGLEDAKKET